MSFSAMSSISLGGRSPEASAAKISSNKSNLTRTQDRRVPYSLELKKASAISGKASSKSSLSQNQ
ncbi:hypothetical protein YC2023_058891 [Brassica napus]